MGRGPAATQLLIKKCNKRNRKRHHSKAVLLIPSPSDCFQAKPLIRVEKHVGYPVDTPRPISRCTRVPAQVSGRLGFRSFSLSKVLAPFVLGRGSCVSCCRELSVWTRWAPGNAGERCLDPNEGATCNVEIGGGGREKRAPRTSDTVRPELRSPLLPCCFVLVHKVRSNYLHTVLRKSEVGLSPQNKPPNTHVSPSPALTTHPGTSRNA